MNDRPTVLLDACAVERDVRIEAGVCVIGAGPAGIVLARELAASGADVCVLESGALELETETQALAAGTNIGDPYYSVDANRQRLLGGTTSLWAGWCRPLDMDDYRPRSWVSDSGWPVEGAALAPYALRAHAACEIESPEYDVSFWERASGAPRLPFPAERVLTRMYTLSPPTRFGQKYRSDLDAASNVRLYLHANAISIDLTPSGTAVESVQVATLSGLRFRVASNCFVLATGGIENARLLLASREDRPHGLGNDHDLVGRFFMEHLHFPAGDLEAPAASPERLDLYHGAGRRFAARLSLPPVEQERERLLNANIMLEPLRSPRRRRWFGGAKPDAFDGIRLHLTLEQAPNPASRVTLADERDALGMPRVSINWRTTALEIATAAKTRELIAGECERLGLGRLRKTPLNEAAWPPEPLQGMRGHHMGTTRMSRDARRGVVDEHCRVHGLDNLFVAGSSVFPTSGAGTPTVTILALALRLADHLKATAHRLDRRAVTAVITERNRAAANRMEPGAAPRTPARPLESILRGLRQRIEETLDPILAGTREVALVGFPNYGNVGDSAIWLGQQSYLDSRGIRLLPASGGLESIPPRERGPMLRGRTILVAGGGNFGDLWSAPQTFREELLEWCRDSPLVQLPQSIHFQSRTAMRRTGDLLKRHGNVTLLLRDRESLEIAREEFAVRSELCPDMALLLKPQVPAPRSDAGILWLCRNDQESRGWASMAAPSDIVRVDWRQESRGRLEPAHEFLLRQRMLHPHGLARAGSLQHRIQNALATRRLRRGLRLLGSARIIVTDRLHGHILATLSGIPHVVLDNTYGKVRSFYDTWMGEVGFAHWCDEPGEAIAHARRLLRSIIEEPPLER